MKNELKSIGRREVLKTEQIHSRSKQSFDLGQIMKNLFSKTLRFVSNADMTANLLWHSFSIYTIFVWNTLASDVFSLTINFHLFLLLTLVTSSVSVSAYVLPLCLNLLLRLACSHDMCARTFVWTSRIESSGDLTVLNSRFYSSALTFFRFIFRILQSIRSTHISPLSLSLCSE